MTLLIQTLWAILAALTVENLLLPGTLGLSRMLRSARKPEHRLWYAGFVAIFSAVSLELSLLITPQLFPGFGEVLRPFCLALCAGAAYCAASFALSRFAPGFFRRHGATLAPAAVNTIVLAMPFARQTLALGALEGLGYAFGTGHVLSGFADPRSGLRPLRQPGRARVLSRPSRRSFDDRRAFPGLSRLHGRQNLLNFLFFSSPVCYNG